MAPKPMNSQALFGSANEVPRCHNWEKLTASSTGKCLKIFATSHLSGSFHPRLAARRGPHLLAAFFQGSQDACRPALLIKSTCLGPAPGDAPAGDPLFR
jgi:hypothetical protein